jgi:metal-responsive CopG/Arc/MetJ family transcriptional regulator
MAQKTRLRFDFSKQGLKRLDEIVKDTKALNRADVVRKALKLYDEVRFKVKEGVVMHITKDQNGDFKIS